MGRHQVRVCGYQLRQPQPHLRLPGDRWSHSGHSEPLYGRPRTAKPTEPRMRPTHLSRSCQAVRGGMQHIPCGGASPCCSLMMPPSCPMPRTRVIPCRHLPGCRKVSHAVLVLLATTAVISICLIRSIHGVSSWDTRLGLPAGIPRVGRIIRHLTTGDSHHIR